MPVQPGIHKAPQLMLRGLSLLCLSQSASKLTGLSAPCPVKTGGRTDGECSAFPPAPHLTTLGKKSCSPFTLKPAMMLCPSGEVIHSISFMAPS